MHALERGWHGMLFLYYLLDSMLLIFIRVFAIMNVQVRDGGVVFGAVELWWGLGAECWALADGESCIPCHVE